MSIPPVDFNHGLLEVEAPSYFGGIGSGRRTVVNDCSVPGGWRLFHQLDSDDLETRVELFYVERDFLPTFKGVVHSLFCH